MATPTFSAKLPDVTLSQLNELAAQFGVSKSQIVIQAVRQLHQQESKTMSSKMTEQQARKLAEEAVEYADTEGHHLGGTIIVGIDLAGKFWVTDNGKEVSGLTEQGAIDIIIENLTATKE